uniref:Uncharacterized protein n=1 Tax=Schistosoma japonicum TaxID=6182 RepID=Q5BY93_SCHJA|nr:unknown [Schistosoma japonicum]
MADGQRSYSLIILLCPQIVVRMNRLMKTKIPTLPFVMKLITLLRILLVLPVEIGETK